MILFHSPPGLENLCLELTNRSNKDTRINMFLSYRDREKEPNLVKDETLFENMLNVLPVSEVTNGIAAQIDKVLNNYLSFYRLLKPMFQVSFSMNLELFSDPDEDSR